MPRSYGWNLIAERQLTGRALARLAYVGSLGRHLWVPVELNPTRYDGTTGGTLARPYAPTYTQPITAAEYSGESSYHSLQASAEVRLRRNFIVLANYTWSKALDNLPPGASATAVASGVSYVLPTYEADYTRLDYGPSDFDHRHVFSLSYVWQLPKMQSGPAALRYLVNGWQTSGIVQARSGGPLTIFSGSNNNSRSAQNRDRAVLTGADPYGAGACSGVTSKCKEYLNPAAFAVNPVGTYGTVQKGYLTGPGYFNWDVNLVREIPFSSRVKAELRLEYFNVLNHTNFNDPATTTGGSLGRITGAGDPRIGQISVKLIF